MTPDLLAAFESGMEDIEEAIEILEKLGPGYLKECLRAGRGYRARVPAPPRGMPPALARAVRELAEDAIVRTLPTGGGWR